MSEWISVKDRLPEGSCLVFLSESRIGRIHSADYSGNVATIGCAFGFDMPEVTHWMPLPEPPEADNDQ